jgi:hypothetical protein
MTASRKILLLWLLLTILNVYVLVLPMMLYFVGIVFVFANFFARAMDDFPKNASTASALLSIIQVVGGMVGSFLVAFGLGYDGDHDGILVYDAGNPVWKPLC